MPAPPSASNAPADPSAWSEAQQQQFMQALMGGAGTTPGGGPLPGMPPLPSTPGGGFNFDPAAAGANGSDPLSALMMQFQNQQPGEQAVPMAPPKPPTLLQKLMPLLHLLSVWVMLGFFVFAKEPLAWSNGGGHWGLGWEVDRDGSWWGMARRWGELGRSAGRGSAGAGIGGYAVQAVVRQSLLYSWTMAKTVLQPFFWAFLTLQLGIHSMRIFSGIVSASSAYAIYYLRSCRTKSSPRCFLLLHCHISQRHYQLSLHFLLNMSRWEDFSWMTLRRSFLAWGS